MPVIHVHCRPKSTEQRLQALRQISAAAAEALDVDASVVQVFITEYDDEHWSKGTPGA